MNFSETPNEELHAMCLRGCEAAWSYLYYYVLTIARSPRWRLRDTPEDLAQGIICHLLSKGVDAVKEPLKFRGFVKRVAVNFILDTFKTRRPYFESLDAPRGSGDETACEQADDNPGPEAIAIGTGFVDAIGRGIRMLSLHCREVLGAYIDYKMGKYQNYYELAGSLGKRVGTLSAQIKRCLDKLRRTDIVRSWFED